MLSLKNTVKHHKVRKNRTLVTKQLYLGIIYITVT